MLQKPKITEIRAFEEAVSALHHAERERDTSEYMKRLGIKFSEVLANNAEKEANRLIAAYEELTGNDFWEDYNDAYMP